MNDDSRHKLQEEDRCYLWIYTYIQVSLVSLVYISLHQLQEEDRCHLCIYTYIQVSLVTPHCIYVYTYIIERERDNKYYTIYYIIIYTGVGSGLARIEWRIRGSWRRLRPVGKQS